MDRYSMEEVIDASREYFHGDEFAARVWASKYALRDSEGNIYELTPKDMHKRIAKELSRIEKKYSNPLSESVFYDVLKNFRYICPQGGPMTGIGNKYQIASLSNCFVIGYEGNSDSYGAIMKIDEEQVQLMKRRGGVGHDLSQIRPKGSPVKNSALTSTGLVPFMERYSNSTREVAQDGRRGALMLSVSIKHPDAESFIDAKMEEGKVTGANVSVKIDDEFMNAVQNDTSYIQQYPIDAPKDKAYIKEIKAKTLWEKIIHNAWKSAEPGVLFWDTIIRESIADCYADMGFKTISTNPCGEIPLCAYDSCRLLAINLFSYVDNPFTDRANFNFSLFEQHVALAQRMMDDIIDLEIEKIDSILEKIDTDPEDISIKRTERELWEKIRKKTLLGRRTGVGTTGEGDMLAALGFKYGTQQATDFSVEVHKHLALYAYKSSIDLAKERGAFPIYDSRKEQNNPFIVRIKKADPELYESMVKFGRRNIACLTIAPTGTTSIMTQTTSGIEPVFMPVYIRRRKVSPDDPNVHIDYVDNVGDSFEEYTVFHTPFLLWMKVNKLEKEDGHKYTQEEVDELIQKSPYFNATAMNVDWIQKVRMQGAVQKWVDHSISVTINLPNDVSEEMVEKLYMEAWKNGCKGCTVYRDGSRSPVLEDAYKKKKNESNENNTETETPKEKINDLINRPESLDCEVVRFQNNKEKWIAFIGLLNNKPFEIFSGPEEGEDGISIPKSVTSGKIIKVVKESGVKSYDFEFYNQTKGLYSRVPGLNKKFNKEFWNYARLISGILRYGMPIEQVVNVIRGLQVDSNSIHTWKMGVERAFKRYIKNGTLVKGEVCPECGQTLIYEEGCMHCPTCGYSKCGG